MSTSLPQEAEIGKKKDRNKFLGDKKCEQPTDIKVRFATSQSGLCGSCYIN